MEFAPLVPDSELAHARSGSFHWILAVYFYFSLFGFVWSLSEEISPSASLVTSIAPSRAVDHGLDALGFCGGSLAMSSDEDTHLVEPSESLAQSHPGTDPQVLHHH